MKTRRIVRTLQLRRPRYFDDQMWPTYVALCALAALSAAIVVADGHFEDPRPWINGWIRLMAVAAVSAGSLWAARTIGPRHNRRLQFCVVLSLIAHTALAVFLHRHHLEALADRSEPAEIAPVETIVIEPPVPEYIVQPPKSSDELQEIEKPLDTGQPQLQTDRLTQERTTPKKLEAFHQLEETSDATPQRLPQPRRRRRTEPAIARREPNMGQRSRRQAGIANPSISASADAPTASAAASERLVTKTESRPVAQPAPELPERGRRMAAAPTVAPAPPSALGDLIAEQTTQRLPQQKLRDSLPRIARDASRTAERRRAEVTATPVDKAITDQVAEETTIRSRRIASAQPTETTIARTIDRRQTQTTSGWVDDETAVEELAPRIAAADRSTASRPSVRPNMPRRLTPRPAELAGMAGTNLPDASDAAAVREAAIPQPAALAITRAEPGFEKPDASAGVEVDTLSSNEYDAPRPDAAAKRRSSTQREQGPSLAPTNAAHIAKQRAEAHAPASTRRATSPSAADVAGAERPGRLSASSGAALQRRASAAPLGDISATVGPMTLDTGSPQIVPNKGRGRGTPGGRPTVVVHSDRRAKRPPRGGATPSAALGGLHVAEVPAMPAGHTAGENSGGGRPKARPRADADRPVLARARLSAVASETTTDGAPTTAIAGSLSMAAVPRRRPADALNGLASGGGSNRPRRSRAPQPAAPLAAATPSLPATPLRSDGSTPADDDRQVVDGAPPSVVSHSIARQGEAVTVITPDAEGDGGLGAIAAPRVGLPDRRAQRQADLVHVAPARMLKKRAGGKPAISGTARMPAAAFSQRGRRQEELLSGGDGKPSAKTEAAIELGLEFLSRLQLADGRWAFHSVGDQSPRAGDDQSGFRADAAATGLALLCFLGAGYDHFDDKYQQQVQAGLHYLVDIQQRSGEIFPESGQSPGAVTRFYSHGIAALALCEAYGMTGDAELRVPAQRALDYIKATQHPQRGGWRYVAGVNADLSVTGWQLMALRSGELAGLEVGRPTYRQVRRLVEACREEGGNRARFRYNPWASATNPRTRHGRQPSTVMTAVGLLAQLYLGSNRDDRLMQRGADHLRRNLPEMGASPYPAPTGTLENPLRDTYYWYYATQVMFHMGGEYWEAWNERLHPLLVDTQTAEGALAGSWNPQQPVPDKWAAYGGRLYVTTMNLLSLEVYYRHLPLYEMTAQ